MATNEVTMKTMDPFESGVAEAEDQKKKMLEAVALAGTAGKQAYADARAQTDAARKADIQRALDLGKSGVASTGDLGGQQDLSSLYANQANVNESNYATGLSNMQASNESYMGKLLASLPILQQQNVLRHKNEESRLGAIAAEKAAQIQREKDAAALAYQQAREMQDRERQWQVEDRNYAAELQKQGWSHEAAMNAAKGSSKAAAGGGGMDPASMSDSELQKYLMGTAERIQGAAKAPNMNDPKIDALVRQENKRPAPGGPAVPSLGLTGSDIAAMRQPTNPELAAKPLEELALMLGIDTYNLDPNRVYGVIDQFIESAPKSTYGTIAYGMEKDDINEQVVADVFNHSDVQKFLEEVQATGATAAQIKEALPVKFPGPNKRRTRLILEKALT